MNHLYKKKKNCFLRLLPIKKNNIAITFFNNKMDLCLFFLPLPIKKKMYVSCTPFPTHILTKIFIV